MQSSKFAAALIALSSLAAGAAFAADAQGPVGDVQWPLVAEQVASTRTRAAVQAEYFAARAAGTLPVLGDIAEPVPQSQSVKTRAEVRADYFQAVKAGTLPKSGEQG